MRKWFAVGGAVLAVLVAIVALLREAPATAEASGGAAPATSRVPSTSAGDADSDSGDRGTARGDRAVAHPDRESASASDDSTKEAPAAPPGAAPSSTHAEPVRGVVMRDDEAPRSPGAVEQMAMSKASIQNAIKAVTPKIKDCYEQALKIEPTLGGTVKVNFTLQGGDDGKGVVTDGEIADSETKSPFFEACVLKEVAGAKFDAPEGGGTVKVTYPFKFASDSL
jgi:hypothetical protein